jgi:tetratricopeptide (TPR) repeat protein
MKSTKLFFAIAVVLPALAAQAADLRSQLAIGRLHYQNGDFKKAAEHFELALKMDGNNAEIQYWAGMSYQRLGDIATPFGGKYNAKALACLTKAVDLAPLHADYRGELFDFLLDSAWSSPRRLRLAAAMLRNTSELDPEYDTMLHRFQLEARTSSSLGARFTRVTLAGPRVVDRIAELPTDWILRPQNR